ncbi:ArsR/SmtB family transcription factor [Agrobacterium cavarae]|uniref:ArsR/SmtB family transcription factor n=1 Tax=Agrobacterium cavarae TaxID=2528239 RepID=UPI003FD3C9B2
MTIFRRLIFIAIADPTRRAMLAALASGEKSIGELAAPHAMSFAGAAKHVGVLTKAGLIERRKVGRHQICKVRPEPLREAQQWLHQWEEFWTMQLDALENALKAPPQ